MEIKKILISKSRDGIYKQEKEEREKLKRYASGNGLGHIVPLKNVSRKHGILFNEDKV